MKVFGKNQAYAPPVLCLRDRNGKLLFQDRIDAFPFPEAVILAGSAEFFGDPTPCEIHRRAVQLRLCSEIEHDLPHNQDLGIDGIPQSMRPYFQEYQPFIIRVQD